jgi:hypothetical protein
MDTIGPTETAFKELNRQRLSILKTLLTDSQRATELCDAWMASGHIADYRAWKTGLRNIDTAEEAYQKLTQTTRRQMLT